VEARRSLTTDVAVGREDTLHVEGFPDTPFRYELVERDTPISSHDTEGNPNPEYDQEIQPRALDREAYRETQRRIHNEIAPQRLADSPSAVEGAPILNWDDDMVLGGRQRMAALQSLPGHAENVYQDWLRKHVADYGIDPRELERFEAPTLVRRLMLELDPDEVREFSQNTDVSPTMEMSPAEKARMDARRLTAEVIESLDVTETGNLNTQGNLNFIRRFMAQIPTTERGKLVTAEGFLNSDGLRRVQNAVLTRAYNVADALHPAIEKMLESPDDKVKTIQRSLLRAAPDFAAYRAMVDLGHLKLVDVMTPLLDAASIVSALRDRGLIIQDWLDQEQFGGKDLHVEGAMKLLSENSTVADLTDTFKDIARLVTNLPQETAGDLFERPALPSPAQVFEMVRDPDEIAQDHEDAQNVQDAVRKLDTDIRTAQAEGDFAKVERLQKEKELLQKKEPC
jgi:hypothetical protein